MTCFKENEPTLNEMYSHLGYWFTCMMRAVDKRRAMLTELLSDKDYNDLVIGVAGKHAMRRPSWHMEVHLAEKVRNKGFGKYIKDFEPINEQDFNEQLQKSELLMKKEATFKGDYRKLLQATINVFKACRFPNHKFSPTTIDNAVENQVNMRSSASFPFYRRKGHVIDKIKHQAELIKDGHLESAWTWPNTRGFRLQIRESKPTELARKIRVMYPYPGSIIILEDTFIMPFIEHFIKTDTFYVIGKNGQEIGNLLRNRFENNNVKRITSLDVSAFDQNLLNETILCAFWIIRRQLKLTNKEALLFEKMVTYFCTSVMVSREPGSPSYGFVKHHGVPSGSGFTNMIDTLAHAIVIEYLTLGNNTLERSLICGDDNIFDSTSLNLQKLYAGYEQIFNLPISIEKTDNYNTPLNVKFLGFNFINYIRHISLYLTINQLIWHPEFYTHLDQYERELARAASILLNGINGRDVFRRLFPEVMNSLNQGYDVRYVYLHGYAPPLKSRELLSKGQGMEVGINSSLLEALNSGYLNR